MRIARVIGQVTVSQSHPGLGVGRWLLVRTANRNTLAGTDAGNDETLVMYDDLGAGPGDLVGLAEGREAAAPFWPRKVPVDAYNAAILEQVDFTPMLPVKKEEQS